jgi:type I restriction enzyme S subunit
VVGTIGRTAVVPRRMAGSNVARAVAVIPIREGVSPEYVSLALSAPSLATPLVRLAHEVARKTLNLEDVRSFRIPIPPYEAQQEVVARAQQQLSIVDAMTANTVRVERRANSLRRAILRAAFAGKLVRQDPADEPAPKLLERIATERTTARRPALRRTRASA